MSGERISVVVPVYFNAESLPRLAAALEEVAAHSDFELEPIFVDDGSGDESWARITAITAAWPGARGIRLTRNFGSQMAILAGLQEATGDAAAVLSADLQEPPDLLPRFVEAWRSGSTAVLAVRAARPEPWPTRAAANLYYRTLKRLAFESMPDGGFDCFLVGRPAIDFLTGSREVNTSLPGLILWAGFPVALVPYDRLARAEGRSRWTVGKKVKYFLDSVISFSYAPLRWMSVVGAAIALLAFGYAILLIGMKIFAGMPFRGWTSLMVALAFFSGVQLLSLGILGEYLWRTLDAARARRGFLVREKTGGQS
ncbi:MAG TPA: glycosyltransferase family 2 protein [Thermoanaerobaculia bacterium]|nr:glycosyltransferase family 2 protein [Thermoanaerobaculia bacterium]